MGEGKATTKGVVTNSKQRSQGARNPRVPYLSISKTVGYLSLSPWPPPSPRLNTLGILGLEGARSLQGIRAP